MRKENTYYQTARTKTVIWENGLISEYKVDKLPPLAGTCSLYIGQMDGEPQISIGNCEPRSWHEDYPGPAVASGGWEEMYEAFRNYVSLL